MKLSVSPGPSIREWLTGSPVCQLAGRGGPVCPFVNGIRCLGFERIEDAERDSS